MVSFSKENKKSKRTQWHQVAASMYVVPLAMKQRNQVHLKTDAE